MPIHGKISNFFTEKIFQVSLISGILFYIVANPVVFSMVEKILRKVFGIVGINVTIKGDKLVMFHALVFAILTGISIKYIFTPIINYINNIRGVVEGYDPKAYEAARIKEQKRIEILNRRDKEEARKNKEPMGNDDIDM